MNSRDKYCPQILDNMETATILLDGAMTVIYVNTSAEALLARSSKRIVGEHLKAIIPSSNVEMAVTLTLTDLSPVVRRDIHYIDSFGREMRINVSVTPISEQRVLLEIRQMDMHLQVYQDESRDVEYLATKKLLRGLAHEIKNPLGGIRGAAQLLALEYEDPGMSEYTDVIIAETDRLRTLIDRMVGPRTPSVFTVSSIHEATEHVFRLVSAELGEGVELQRDYDPSIPNTMFDRDQLIQSLLNLVRNALESVGEAGRIIIRTRILRKYNLGNIQSPLVVQISVEDNGPGIPQGLQSEIFFPMITSKATGTGLGLSITQSLIRAHGGLVKFHSVPRCTVFEILLPVKIS